MFALPAYGSEGQRNEEISVLNTVELMALEVAAVALGGKAEVDGVVQRPLLHIAEHLAMGAPAGPVVIRSTLARPVPHVARPAHREDAVGAVVIVQRQPDLLEVVGALRSPGRLTGRLDGRQEQGDQDRDDGDDHEQLDERERSPRLTFHRSILPEERNMKIIQGDRQSHVEATGSAAGQQGARVEWAKLVVWYHASITRSGAMSARSSCSG